MFSANTIRLDKLMRCIKYASLGFKASLTRIHSAIFKQPLLKILNLQKFNAEFFFLLIIIPISSCGVNHELNVNKKFKRTASTLDLNSNNRYKYEFLVGTQYEHSSGVWTTIGKDSIILNSDLKTKNISPEIVSLHKLPIDDSVDVLIKIHVLDKVDDWLNKYLFAELHAGDKIWQIKNNSNQKLPKSILRDSVYINILADTLSTRVQSREKYINTTTLNLLKSEDNFFQITINIPFTWFNYLIFKNELFLSKRKKITWTRSSEQFKLVK